MTLIDRLSKLDGPDREVDAEIAAHFRAGENLPDWGDGWGKDWRPQIDGQVALTERSGYPMHMFRSPEYTASVDAAIALAERVLPDHDFIVGKTNGGLTIHAQVGPNEVEFGPNLAIALCIALLRAKEASNGQ